MAKGSTTIDRRGATKGWAIELVPAAVTGVGSLEVFFATGQTHHAIRVMTTVAATAAST